MQTATYAAPRFDEAESRDVALDDGGRCARFGDLPIDTAGRYPDPNCNAAYVHAGHTLAALHSSASTPAVVHFRIDCLPSTVKSSQVDCWPDLTGVDLVVDADPEFCVTVTQPVRPERENAFLKTITVVYFSDGNVL